MRDDDIDLGRVAALSDGIFAVAMTLLVVALPLPKNAAELGVVPLREHVTTLLPPVRAIVLSFVVAAVFWRAHQGFFLCLARGDRTLVWLNFLLLFAVVLTPVSTHLLGNFHIETLNVGLYAANLALIGGSLFAMWLHAARRRSLLLRPDVDARRVRYALWLTAFLTLVFLASTAVAWVEPAAAMWMWLLTVPLSVIRPRRTAR